MRYKANIIIKLRPSILDPQGKVTRQALQDLGYPQVETVRIGKFMELWVNAATEEEANQVVREACEKLLANPVMENFSYTLEAVETVSDS